MKKVTNSREFSKPGSRFPNPDRFRTNVDESLEVLEKDKQ